MMLSTGGKVIRTRAAEVSVYGRGASGVHLIRLGEDTLQSVRIVARTGEETDEDIDHLDIEIPEDADVEEPDDLDEELDVAADEADDDANAER